MRADFINVFIDLSNVKVPFLEKMKSFLGRGFYLNLVKEIKCILNDISEASAKAAKEDTRSV